MSIFNAKHFFIVVSSYDLMTIPLIDLIWLSLKGEETSMKVPNPF